MKKPDFLTGEALTFLECANEINSNRFNNLCVDERIAITKFYSQPFTKDMIVRPEKYRYAKPETLAKHWQPLFKGEWEVLPGGYINYGDDICWDLIVDEKWSTDDFIRESKKAGIKLEWK